MPLCVYLCHTPGCQVKVERWMPTAGEGADAMIPCPRCGNRLSNAWKGEQTRTPDLKDASAGIFQPKR
jgi:hypothetical protein